MKTPAPADMQRWSDEVARDPRSLAFLPLARAYRRQGLREAAMQLCLRGLEAYPSHVEAHGMLALLYLETGDSTKAADEWSMVLRIDPDNFDALRGMGFCLLEQDKLSRARQMLERAALQRPGDTAVQEALHVLGTRQELAEHGIARTADAAVADDPWDDGEAGDEAGDESGENSGDKSGDESGDESGEISGEISGDEAGDPVGVFDEVLASGPLIGALLVDGQGLVLAGRLVDDAADSAVLGAVLGGAVGEATRTALHLSLGEWRGILLEAEHALLHLSPVGSDAVVVLAAHRRAPAGWLVRAAAQAVARSARFLEAYA